LGGSSENQSEAKTSKVWEDYWRSGMVGLENKCPDQERTKKSITPGGRGAGQAFKFGDVVVLRGSFKDSKRH